MKQDTAIVVTKGFCYVVVGFFTPLSVGLAQWANSGQWPSNIIWVVIGSACATGAATQLLSYLSGSYSDYVKGRANGSAQSGDTTMMLLSKASQQQTTTTPPKP